MGTDKKTLVSLPKGTKVPNHIAMILDGNRRWARARGKQPWEGHKAGYMAIRELARASRALGVHTFTVWAWSTENWERPDQEIKEIFGILRGALKEAEKELHEEKVRMVHLGRKDRMPSDVVEEISRLERDTRKYGDKHVFNLALDYGGHDEILRAVNKIYQERVINGDKSEITKIELESNLDTCDQPYPYVDLFIRTSGEQRTSGLLPWQMDYAEYYWVVDHLPDFDINMLCEAIMDFSRRRRRFGANDAEEHMKFNPRIVADLEIKWRHALKNEENENLQTLIIKYVKEHYGLSKDLAKTAGISLARALVHRKRKDWNEAQKALEGLYEVVQKTLKLAFEPQILAKFEVDLWRHGESEAGERKLLGEKFRFSELQASKSAHLLSMANKAYGREDNKTAKKYFEMYYEALKERVA